MSSASQVEDQLERAGAPAPRPGCSPSTAAPACNARCSPCSEASRSSWPRPGRLKDLLDRGALRLDDVHIAVVDEADRMADMGFLPEVRRLLDKVRDDRQTLLFSATLDGDVDVLIKQLPAQPGPPRGRVAGGSRARSPTASGASPTASASRWPPPCSSRCTRPSCSAAPVTAPSACRSSSTSSACPSEAIHGDRSQSQREKALAAFGRGQVSVLVATDVAARGIHVDGVACVLQFDPPATDKDYVHRSGRTGRAGAPGIVINFVTPEKDKDVRKLMRELRRREADRDRHRRQRRLGARSPSRRSRWTAATSSTASRVASGPAPSDPTVPQPRDARPGQERSRKPHRKGQGAPGAGAGGPSTERPRRELRPGRRWRIPRSWAASPRPAMVRSAPGPRHAPDVQAPSPVDDPQVLELPVRAAPPAATHAEPASPPR